LTSKVADFSHDALAYACLGFSIIPTIGKKPFLNTWKRYQIAPMPIEKIPRHFASRSITGLAVVLGGVSGDLCCRDFDDEGAYQAWAAKHPDFASTLPTAKTASGFHVYFRRSGQTTRKLGDGELRGEGSYCLLPPSKHPDGPIYEWIREPSDEIPIVDPTLAGLSQTWGKYTEGTEVQRHRGTEGTDVVGDGGGRKGKNPTSPTAICSIEQAVRAAIPTEKRQNHDFLFRLARALLALQDHWRTEEKLLPNEALSNDVLRNAFDLWHRNAGPLLRPDQTRDEYFLEFLAAWEDARIPLGESSMNQILETARKSSPPDVVFRNGLSDPRIILLVKFCRELQRETGEKPFYLACRTVQQLFNLGSPRTAHRWLKGLHGLKIINTVEKGGPETRKATRFRYLPPLDEVSADNQQG